IRESWLPLLDLHPEVKSQLHRREIGVNAGLALTALPREEQVPLLSEVKAEVAATGNGSARVSAARVAARVREKQGKAPSKTPSVRIQKMKETLTRFVKKGADGTKEELLAVISTLCSLATDASLNKFTARVKAEEAE